MFWTPDFCPPGPSCTLEIERDWSKIVRFVRCCPHHQSLRDSGLDDQRVFAAILQSSRVKEAARAAAKTELGLDKEHPGLPFTVAADGSITVLTGINGERTNGLVRALVRTAVDAAVALVEKPEGTSTVTVT